MGYPPSNDGDGFVGVDTSNTWAGMRLLSEAKGFSTNGTTDNTIAEYLGIGSYSYHQIWMEFDTSSITRNVDEASLSIYCVNATASSVIRVLPGTWSNTAVQNDVLTLNKCDFTAPYSDGVACSSSTLHKINLNNAARIAIRDNSLFKIMIVENHQMSDSTPPTTGQNFDVEIAMANNSNSSLRPSLDIIEAAVPVKITSGLIKVNQGKVMIR